MYQLGVRHLIFKEDDWYEVHDRDLEAEIRRSFTEAQHPGLRAKWGLRCRTGRQGEREPRCYVIALWISHEGHTVGFKPPTVAERSRICGIANLASDLRLTDNQLFDGQGNFFDSGALAMRMHGSIAPWLKDKIDLPRHAWDRPIDIAQMYADLRQSAGARGRGAHAKAHPVPRDLVLLPQSSHEIA